MSIEWIFKCPVIYVDDWISTEWCCSLSSSLQSFERARIALASGSVMGKDERRGDDVLGREEIY